MAGTTDNECIPREHSDEEPCGPCERRQAHAEGEHCFCGDECDACPTCAGSGADPDDEGDYDYGLHMHNPTTRRPCPDCAGTGKQADEDAPNPPYDLPANVTSWNDWSGA